MAVILEKLYETVKQYDIHCVAGKDGLDRIVNWFHVMETLEIESFLEEHAIIFTTGIALTDEMELFSLIRAQIEKRASGLIINIGPYIKKIPEQVIHYCDEKQYPLFTAPWNVSLPKIMKIFSYAILESEKAGIELSAALKNAISFPIKTNLYAPAFYQYGFLDNDDYCMVILEPAQDKKEINADTMSKLVKMTERLLMSYGDKSFIINAEGVFLLLFSNYRTEDILLIVTKVLSSLRSIWKDFYVGIGNNMPKLVSVSVSYVQAFKVINLNKKQNVKNTIVTYNELGLYKLLLSIEDNRVLKEYYDDTLGPLKEYDRRNHSDYSDVLKLYLENDGSINETARILFLHRNTVNYKIRKVEELLSCNLSSIENRVKLYIAFCLEEILNSQ